MTYQKFCKNNKGMIIVDIMLAFSLCTLFIFSIIQIIDSTERLYARAKEKKYLINLLSENMYKLDDISEYSSKQISISKIDHGFREEMGDAMIVANSVPWGNTMQEIFVDMNVVGSNFHEYMVVTKTAKDLKQTINKTYSYCSPNLGLIDNIGSYSYTKNLNTHRNGQYEPKINLASSTAIIFPLNPLLTPTDFEIHHNIALISIDSNIASDPDMVLSDISNIRSPIIKSVLNTGPGISSFITNDREIYASAASTASQLHIMKINPDYSLSLISKYQLLLPYATATPPFGTSILFDADHVYLGTSKWDGEEFNVIDVHNPARPLLLGSYEIGSKVESLMKKDNLIYIATANSEQLLILDISDPSNIRKISSFSPAGFERQEGKAVAHFENRLFFGRTSGGFDISNEHELFAWNSTSSEEISNSSNYNSVNFSGGIYGIIPSRFALFSITRKGGSELSVFGYQPLLSLKSNISLPILPQSIFCEDRSIYVLSHNTPSVYKLSFNNHEDK